MENDSVTFSEAGGWMRFSLGPGGTVGFRGKFIDADDASRVPQFVSELKVFEPKASAVEVDDEQALCSGDWATVKGSKSYPYPTSPNLKGLPPTVCKLSLKWYAVGSLECFGSLTKLELAECKLELLPKLPSRLVRLRFFRCYFTQAPRFTMQNLQTLESFAVEDCKPFEAVEKKAKAGLFFLDMPGAESALQTLSFSGPTITDACFEAFPENLTRCVFKETQITKKTIEKLPKLISNLVIKECGGVDLARSRTQAYFPNCQLEGLSGQSWSEDVTAVLQKRVLGQPQAIRAAAEAIFATGEHKGERPVAVLFFGGPSGVGKTELAQAIADASERNLHRYDMAEYQEHHTISRLIGSPPGYVGSLEGGQLTNAIRKDPKGIILLDEIEKAHSDITKVFLGVFDAGRMTDGQGKMVDFSQTIIIMTSNLAGAEVASLDWSDGSDALKNAETLLQKQITKHVSPEFTGRIDAVVPFRALVGDVLKQIVRQKLADYCADKRKGNPSIFLTIDDEVWLLDLKLQDPKYGARLIVNQLHNKLNAHIGRLRANKALKEGDHLHVMGKQISQLVVAVDN
jgi:AAA domain (Cdc48 subfamily)